jgi:hypothetical protein
MDINLYNTIALLVFFAIIPWIVRSAENKNVRDNVTFEQWAGGIVRELILTHAQQHPFNGQHS